jgi:hypothetical protein
MPLQLIFNMNLFQIYNCTNYLDETPFAFSITALAIPSGAGAK